MCIPCSPSQGRTNFMRRMCTPMRWPAWLRITGSVFTERRLRPISRRGAAAYVSSYFVTGKKGKEALQQSVLSPDMPRSIIYVSTKLTKATGVTMRELRFRRFVWHVARRAGCDLQEARTIAELARSDALDLTVDAFSASPGSSPKSSDASPRPESARCLPPPQAGSFQAPLRALQGSPLPPTHCCRSDAPASASSSGRSPHDARGHALRRPPAQRTRPRSGCGREPPSAAGRAPRAACRAPCRGARSARLDPVDHAVTGPAPPVRSFLLRRGRGRACVRAPLALLRRGHEGALSPA